LENSNGDYDVDVDINRASETIKQNTKASATEILGYHEFKQHIPRFAEEGSRLLHQRKQAQLPWHQSKSQTNGDIRKNRTLR